LFLFLKIRIKITICNRPATILAIKTDLLSIKYPYTPHRITPESITKYIKVDTPFEDLVFQTLINCGIKEEVVRIAAIKPIIS
jgi:hypothetical protein